MINYLIKEKIVKKFHKPKPCSFETLKEAHSEDYINHIKNKNVKPKRTLNKRSVNGSKLLDLYFFITKVFN